MYPLRHSNEHISIDTDRVDNRIIIEDKSTGITYTHEQIIDGLNNKNPFFIDLASKYLDLLSEIISR